LRSSFIHRIESLPHRDLYFFALYRVLVAMLVVALVFSPFEESVLGANWLPGLAKPIAVTYLVTAMALLWVSKCSARWLHVITSWSTLADILAAMLLIRAMPDVSAAIASILIFSIAQAAVLLPLERSFGVAIAAGAALLAEYLGNDPSLDDGARRLSERILFVASYLAVAWICCRFAKYVREQHTLAQQRHAEVINLFEINELIIRRMRTGVLVVDGQERIVIANEAATTLLGQTDSLKMSDHIDLSQRAPELALRLQRWREQGHNEESNPLQLAPGQAEVQPRFARLLVNNELTLVFLDDTSVVSQRAEALTLSTMNRFSASMAHEIRNPLAAISHAAQLLQESEHLDTSDQRLLEIILQQCRRTNNIIENVLGLARRQPARPESLDLGAFVQRFVAEYQPMLMGSHDQLHAIVPYTHTGLPTTVLALIDPCHLHQVLTALVQNALTYGRSADQTAQVHIRVASSGRQAMIEVIDHGPGVSQTALTGLFRPFHTTSEHGTGLGLYIARELCRANQAQLDSIARPQGACFRISLADQSGHLQQLTQAAAGGIVF